MENWTYVYSSTCRYILKRNFGTCGAGDVCENFLNGNVQTSKNKTKQKWRKTRYYCKENEYMVHLHNVGLFCSENEWTATTCNNMGESWKHNIAWKNQTLQDRRCLILLLQNSETKWNTMLLRDTCICDVLFKEQRDYIHAI